MRRFSTSVSMMWRDLPIAERFAAAKAAGFIGAEIQVPAEAEPEVWAAAAADSGLPILLVNLDMGDFLVGGVGLSGVPGREDAFADALERGIELVRSTGAGLLHIGPSRVADGQDRAACLETYLGNLALAQRAVRDLPVTLVVEAVNRAEAPTALIGTTAEAAEAIERVGQEVRLLFDLYHSVMAGEDPVESYRLHAGMVAHIQFSDIPRRTPPGTGTLDFAGLFKAIEGQGYDGAYGAEYMSLAATQETLGWMVRLQ